MANTTLISVNSSITGTTYTQQSHTLCLVGMWFCVGVCVAALCSEVETVSPLGAAGSRTTMPNQMYNNVLYSVQ